MSYLKNIQQQQKAKTKLQLIHLTNKKKLKKRQTNNLIHDYYITLRLRHIITKKKTEIKWKIIIKKSIDCKIVNVKQQQQQLKNSNIKKQQKL